MDLKDLAYIGTTGDMISRLTQIVMEQYAELQRMREEIARLTNKDGLND